MSVQVKVIQRPESFEQDAYLPAVVKGLGVTMRHFFENLFGRKHVVTIQYPDEHKPYPKRNRGLHQLTKRDDGEVRCVACMCCPTVCPAHCITIVAEDTGNGLEKRPKIFEIDELRCVVCGLCVEACPCDAIRMDTGRHAPPVTHRGDAVWGKIDLMELTRTVSTAHQGGIGPDWREQQPPVYIGSDNQSPMTAPPGAEAHGDAHGHGASEAHGHAHDAPAKAAVGGDHH